MISNTFLYANRNDNGFEYFRVNDHFKVHLFHKYRFDLQKSSDLDLTKMTSSNNNGTKKETNFLKDMLSFIYVKF